MNKDEMKDEMKDKISMALKDPILQQGFEIICKNLAELEKENAELKAGKDMADTDLATIAYMQGAERYKTKWHNLQKDPNDVPNDNRYVWTNVGAGYHDNDGWWNDFGRLQNVIAWCEPKFKE